MKSMREDLKAVERLRKTAEQLSRQERDKPTTGAGAVKATAFGVPLSGASRFTTYLCIEKTAVQVFPYGGRLFICRTSRCATGAGQRQHQNIIPHAVDKQPVRGECDIPDGPPNRRTGHGRGFIRQRFAHRQQRYDLLQQFDLQATLDGPFVVLLKLVVI